MPDARPSRLDPRDDLVHPPRDEKGWRESYYWDACDPAGDLMLYATFGKRPFSKRSGFLMAIWDGEAETLLAGQDVDTFERHDDDHSIAGLELECLEPFRRWRMTYEGELLRCPPTGARRRAEPRRIPPQERDPVAVAYELEFTCVGEPRVYEPAAGWGATFDGHHEQSTLAGGWLEIDGARRPVEALPGIRDHSWGTRDWHGVKDSRWVAVALEDGTDVSLMRQTRLDGAVVLDGGVYRDGAALPVRGYEEEVEFEPGGEPPEAARISMRVETADGERLELRGEVRAMLPIRFVSRTEPRRVTWNDRSFVAFEADGRRGFGTVEFQTLLED